MVILGGFGWVCRGVGGVGGGARRGGGMYVILLLLIAYNSESGQGGQACKRGAWAHSAQCL